MAPKFEGFAKSAPQGKPVSRALLRQETEQAAEGSVATVEPPPGETVSAWSADEVYDLNKLAVAIRVNTQEVLETVSAKHEEMVRALLSKQEELGRHHERLVNKLTEVNKRDSTFLIAILVTMVAFAVIYLLK